MATGQKLSLTRKGFHGAGQDRVQMRIVLLAIHLVQGLIFDVFEARRELRAQQRRCRHHHFGVAVRIGVTDPGIELGVVFHASIQTERRLP